MPYFIKSKANGGCAIAVVDEEPKWLTPDEYVEVPDSPALQSGFFSQTWVGDDGSYTIYRPYEHRYHYFDKGRWRLDHDKIEAHITHAKDVFKHNIEVYREVGVSAALCDYLLKQVKEINTLSGVEEFITVKVGGEYAHLYDYRLSVAM